MTEDKPTSAERESTLAFTEWARSRLDEMDSAVRAMQAKAQQLTGPLVAKSGRSGHKASMFANDP